jgi:holo-[acyl-carrier protein] synthase
MIIGIGTDIVQVSRIERVLKKNPRFEQKVFTPAESAYCNSRANPAQSFSARFAAKEALMKALGTGWDNGISWLEIEVLNNEFGKPAISLSGTCAEAALSMGIKRLHLSLSHEKEYAIAYLVAEA